MKYLVLILLSMQFACNNAAPENTTAAPLSTDSMKAVLMKIDLEFSDRSAAVGVNKAFIEFIDDNATLLRPNMHPVTGKDQVIAYLSARVDTAYKLTWKPLYADIAASGDLGYTFGTYTLQTRDSAGQEEGTYVSIWKADSNGHWKYVLDSGNAGLSPTDTSLK